jgi:hypothetical protein
MTLTPAQTAWLDRARDADILAVAQRSPINAKLKKHGREWIGPCPACGGTDRFAISPTKKGGVFVCRGSDGGGDAIALVRHICKVEFLQACEIINGDPMPAAQTKISAAEIKAAAEQRELERQAAERKRVETESRYRESERKTAFAIWHAHQGPFAGTPGEAYYHGRGILALPDDAPLRYAPEVAYFHGEEDDGGGRMVPRVIYRGPAVLAAIVDIASGAFRGVHITWIDVSLPGTKMVIRNPDDDEILPSKKVRGSKQGNIIALAGDPRAARRWKTGEGNETVLSVWYAMHAAGRDLADTAFVGGVDLGNLAGRAVASVRHPTLKDKAGRVLRVAGPEPDLKSPAIAVPDNVEDVMLLGDGDSDRFTTHCALARAGKRFRLNSEAMTRIGRTVRVAWAPDGADFNDVLRAA